MGSASVPWMVRSAPHSRFLLDPIIDLHRHPPRRRAVDLLAASLGDRRPIRIPRLPVLRRDRNAIARHPLDEEIAPAPLAGERRRADASRMIALERVEEDPVVGGEEEETSADAEPLDRPPANVEMDQIADARQR